MPDTFTEARYTSWGQRLKNAVGGVVIGLALFVGSFFLLSWNEGRSVDRIRTLDAGLRAVAEIDPANPDPAHDGALVHFSGQAESPSTVDDPEFGLTLSDTLRLRRIVEMYQWKESKHETTTEQIGGGQVTKTTYSYHKAWSPRHIDSGQFRHPAEHTNPGAMPHEGVSFTASPIRVGRLTLTGAITDQIGGWEPYPLSDSDVASMRLPPGFRLNGSQLYKGDPANPSVGDMRVRFESVAPGTISVVGALSGQRVTSHKAPKGSIALVERGEVDAATMFAHAKSANALITWIVRFGGFFMMWAGLAMMLNPLRVLFAFLPFLGTIVGAGTGLLAGLAALILSTLTIALAWLAFRPILAFGLLAAAVFGLFAGGRVLYARGAARGARAESSLPRNDDSQGPVRR
jgi:hypothetical protein